MNRQDELDTLLAEEREAIDQYFGRHPGLALDLAEWAGRTTEAALMSGIPLKTTGAVTAVGLFALGYASHKREAEEQAGLEVFRRALEDSSL